MSDPRCVCGTIIKLIDNDPDRPEWIHTILPGVRCPEAIPAAGMPTKADRTDLTEKLKSTGERLDKAAQDMRKLREQMDAVDRRMAALDAGAELPKNVRRATLNQVWDKLVDAGNMTGAAVVMKMIDSGDWS